MDKTKTRLTDEQFDKVLAEWHQHLEKLWLDVEDCDEDTRDSRFLNRSIMDLNKSIEVLAPEMCPESLADLNERMTKAALAFVCRS